MDVVALIARLLLAIVFGVAAVAKALDMPGSRQSLAEFGVPERAIPTLAVLLPLAEFAIAVALVVQPTARWAALAAGCLLVLFIVAIGRAMSRGEAPDCHCFGKLASGLADRRVLIRDVLLAVPAVFVVAYGAGESVDQWGSGRSAAELVAIAAGLCAAVLAVWAARLWQANRRMSEDIGRRRLTDSFFPPGLPVGAPAPDFSWPGADGATNSLAAVLRRGRPVAVVFVSPDCGPCGGLMPDLARWQATLAERITILLLSGGSIRDSRAIAERYGLENMIVQDDLQMSKRYRARAMPSVVIVGPDGRIASRTYYTRMMTEAVIRSALQVEYAPMLNVVTANGDAVDERAAETHAPSNQYERA
jgi:uncharacterized membrane protein YphA (DoxX/SURF4 family)/peroxiredoxin